MGDVKFRAWFVRLAFFLGMTMLLAASGIAASVNPPTLTPRRKARGVTENQHAKKRMRTLARSRAPRSRYATHRRHRYYERFSTSSFASDISEGDVTAGEDPTVRAAAIDALGNMNGTVVAIEPTSGRILAMVNQKLARSNNPYFEALGRKLGFEKISYYEHQFGLGEYAGYHVAGEQMGTYPEA